MSGFASSLAKGSHTLANYGSRLISNGYRILPIKQGEKRPDVAGWQNINADQAQLERWLADGKGPGVGILGEQTPGIDLDISDAAVLADMQAWCEREIGQAPVRIGRAPRALLVYRADQPFGKTRSRKFKASDGSTHQIEILAKGSQYVAHAIHPDTGQPYAWPNGDLSDMPVDFLNALSEAKARELIAYFEANVPDDWTVIEGSGGTLGEHEGNPAKTASLQTVKAALAAIPNEELDYEAWVRIGYALKNAVGVDDAEGRALFHEWSEKSAKYDLETTEKTWDGAKPKNIGAGTLFHEAEKNGWKRPIATASDDFEVLDVEIGEPSPAIRQQIVEAAARAAFHTLSLGEAMERAVAGAAPVLIDGLLDQGTLAVVYGRPNCGKSFVSLDIAGAIATGRPWNGRDTAQGLVVYIAAEGGAGILRRLRALAQEKAIPHDAPLRIAPCAVDLFAPNADLAKVIAHIETLVQATGQACRLVVVDTLARVLGAGDENAGKDMGQLVANLDRLRVATGATVLAVHHSGKDAAKGSRGHSSLLGAVDTEIEIAERKIRTTKQRDHEPLDPELRFELDSVSIGTDANGRPLTSCVVRYPGADEFPAMPVSESADRLRGVLGTLLAQTGAEALSLAEWNAGYCRTIDPKWQPGQSEPKGCSERSLRVLRKELADSGHVAKLPNGLFALTESPAS